MNHERFAENRIVPILLAWTAALTLSVGCGKSTSSGGDKASASADPPALPAASGDAPKAMPNSSAAAQVPAGGAGAWDHHCDVASTRTCLEWGQADKSECDAAQGTYGSGPCVRTPVVLGTCVLATGVTSMGEPAPVKRILYNLGPGGAMKADSAHAMCEREQLAGASAVTHMWKDGPAASRK